MREIGVGVFSENPSIPGIPVRTLSDALMAHLLKAQEDRFAIQPAFQEAAPLIVEISEEKPADWKGLIPLKPSLIILSPSSNRLHYMPAIF